ncbi:MAG TPA: NADH-quinone oxidoreductase subunit M [Caulobacterales bacterium]|jgi:NADH-quinone oxidoreductase subunit M|nr:NADH-quinone oxidoreductase subunit M [Caulobacterales bacterium]
MTAPLLTLIVFTPAAGALLLMAARTAAAGADPRHDRDAKWMTFVISLVPLAVSLYALAQFNPAEPGFQLVEDRGWTDWLRYHLGVDSISMALVILTTALMPICILASWSIQKQVTSYMVLFLILETTMLGVFCALDIVLFYVFFEGGLIPMFILIGVWGGNNRVYAAFKFFLYTLLGSILMLIALIAMAIMAKTTSIPELMKYPFPAGWQTWLFLAFFASFAVKMPMWPVHTWLPDAHVEAPTAGSVMLASVLLKMGGYGFLRFSLPMFPNASHDFTPLIFALSVIAIIYASLTAFRQTDMKKLIAYSSVAHMGFVTMGIFTGTEQGLQGAMFQMLSHGIISGALFLCVGVIYDRMHTREIAFYGGLVNKMPVYAAVFLLFTLGNVGLPGTSGFPGEILTMVGAFQINVWVAAGAATGVIFSAVYALTLYRKVALGVIENPKLAAIPDLELREWAIFVPLIVATLAVGLAPGVILDFTRASIHALAETYNAAGAAPGAIP